MRMPWSRRPDPDCEVHTAALVHRGADIGARSVDLEATLRRLQDRTDDGRMSLVRGDCPIDGVLDALRDERWLTMHLMFRCHGCGWVVDLAVSPRSSAIPYERVDDSALETVRFHDSPLLVDQVPWVSLRTQ